MVKRTQSLPLNTIILAIIAIFIGISLVLIFTGGINQPTPHPHPIPPLNQTKSTQCLIYAIAIQIQMGNYNNSLVQLQMLANSQYVSSGCSNIYVYQFTLYNNSEVVCGLGSDYCISLQGSGCNHCTPPGCIPGCQLK
jgi:hypothetical protein